MLPVVKRVAERVGHGATLARQKELVAAWPAQRLVARQQFNTTTSRAALPYWPVSAKLPYLPYIRRATPGRNLNLKPHYRKGGHHVWTISGCRTAETG